MSSVLYYFRSYVIFWLGFFVLTKIVMFAFAQLREDHHLKHYGRMQLGLFLKVVYNFILLNSSLGISMLLDVNDYF